MNILHDASTFTEDAIESIDFFHDFIAFLRRLNNNPIKRTLTGNISLKNIELLIKELKTTQKKVDEYKEYGWKLRTEQELQTLEQIKILSDVMRLSHKKKDKIFLSKKGREFLKNYTPSQQYKLIILHYWYRVNWDYFSMMRSIRGATLNNVLQNNQNKIWHSLLCKNTQWIDYKNFCYALRDYFHLEPFIEDPDNDPDHELFSDIESSLFDKNLLLFNCVEIEKISGKYDWQTEINRFRSTQIGLYLYQKALYENNL